MTATRPTTSTYWKSAKLCLARPDGSAEVHHHDGRVERFGGESRQRRAAADASGRIPEVR